MLTHAFLDDSADGKQERVFVAAGFLGNRIAWREMRKKWKTRLKVHGIDYYKSSLCRRVDGPFYKFRKQMGLEAAIIHCAKIREDLTTILLGSKGLIGFAHGINLRDFREVDATPQAQLHAFWDSDYYLVGFKLIIGDIVHEVANSRVKNALVGFVCDDTNKKYKLLKAYDDFKLRFPGTAQHMRNVGTLDDKINPPLQIADLAADVSRELLEKAIETGRKQSNPKLPDSLVSVRLWEKYDMLKCLNGEESCP